MYAQKLFKSWTDDQRPRLPTMKAGPVFYRNLEQAMDSKRQGYSLLGFKPPFDRSVSDFSTNDFLSLARTGTIRETFLQELAENPEFTLGAAGSRIQFGNYEYINRLEAEIAGFHGYESCYVHHTCYVANTTVLAGVMQPGDAIVYDELVHTSTHEGMKLSLATHRLPFKHNDPNALRDVLTGLKKTKPEFVAGSANILICAESFYSMDGDAAPLREYVQVVKEEFPLGNAQFIVDEAHSVGVLGQKGRGLVSLLGLEKDIAILTISAGKALGSIGGLILSNVSVRNMIANYSRSIAYSCAPPFTVAASIRSGYKFLMSGASEPLQVRIQDNVKLFFRTLLDNPIWEEAVDEGLLRIPLIDDYEERAFQAHIVPIRCRNRHEQFLFFHLLTNNFNAYPIAFPVVPKNQTRVRVVFHAHNTPEQVTRLADTICQFASEMLAIERGDSDNTIPAAARQVYAIQSAAVEV